MFTTRLAASSAPPAWRHLRSPLLAVAAVLTVVASLAPAQAAAAAPTPPTQLTTGPGSSGTLFSSATTIERTFINSDYDYWTITPSGTYLGTGSPPTRLPVVVFLHGYGGTNPSYDQDWLNHLAEMGNYVIFPVYGSVFTPTSFYEGNAIHSIKDALTNATRTPYTPDSGLGMNLIGYSAGDAVGINLANDAAVNGLPTPRSFLMANSWNGVSDIGSDTDMMDRTLSSVPASTRIDCLVGGDDGDPPSNNGVGRLGCDKVWERIPQVINKDYIWMSSDSHGSPALVANHYAPAQPGTASGAPSSDTALDFYGYWKLGDALGACSMFASECTYAQGGGSDETFMGDWSDGVPVIPLQVYETVNAPPCPPSAQAQGCALAPTGVSATGAGAGTIKVSWTPGTGSVSVDPANNKMVGWRVTATPHAGGPPINTVYDAPSSTTFTITGLNSTTAYDVTVAAINTWIASGTTTTNAPSQPVGSITPN